MKLKRKYIYSITVLDHEPFSHINMHTSCKDEFHHKRIHPKFADFNMLVTARVAAVLEYYSSSELLE